MMLYNRQDGRTTSAKLRRSKFKAKGDILFKNNITNPRIYIKPTPENGSSSSFAFKGTDTENSAFLLTLKK